MKGSILIVDDDPDMVEMLCLVLTESGYETGAAVTGNEALGRPGGRRLTWFFWT